MRSLLLELDNLDFAQLVERGRSAIAPLAPNWTDHNVHDPGIMLIELLAWLADNQVYSLARNPRRDERLGYAHLMGVTPFGPAAATGLVWPEGTTWPSGTVLGSDRPFKPKIPDGATFHATHPIYLTTSRLVNVFPHGSDVDHAARNRDDGSSFQPFGAAPDAGSRLRLEFQPTTTAAQGPRANGYLSLGVEVPGDEIGSASTTSPLRVVWIDSRGEQPVEIVLDSTAALSRTGVLLLRPDDQSAIDGTFTLLIDNPSGAWPAVPRVTRIQPNVVPIEQRERVDTDLSKVALGLPAERADLPRAGIQFGKPRDEITVEVSEHGGFEPWAVVPDLDDRSPNERCVVVDYENDRLVFGNGINGAMVPAGATVKVKYHVSDGTRGNLSAGQSWSVPPIAGIFGRNPRPIAGGQARWTPLDLQIQARKSLREDRPLISAADLMGAAMALGDLGVLRALEAPVPERGRVAGLRRLLVLAQSVDVAAGWFAAIHTRLAPRLPLGQRLEVTHPRLTPLRIAAVLEARPRVTHERVLNAAKEELVKRFAITGDNVATLWPFGRDVSVHAIRGWLRKVPGVARVVSLRMNGSAIETLDVGRNGLPLFEFIDGDIQVLRPGEEAP